MTRLATLSAPVYDQLGHLEFELLAMPEQDITRRASRVMTLDGGAAVNDGGYSAADLSFELTWQYDALIDAGVARLQSLYSRAILSVRAGVFEVVMDRYRPGAESQLRCLVVSQLSA